MTEPVEKFCAICECKLGDKDSEHVCRTCFHKAREQKKPECIYISERAAKSIGTALAVGQFVNWGIQKLIDLTGQKLPPPPKTPEEAEQRSREARQKLRDIQKRMREKLDEADPDGGPDRGDSN